MNDHETHQGRILLVEDEALIALSEKKTLEKYGHEVVTANSGEKAVETATQDTGISLVLMDIDLGRGIDGTEAAEQILKARSLPIVFLTSHSEKEYVDRVKKITSYGYVLKNSGEFVLNESINMALQLFEANQRAQQRENELRTERDKFRTLADTSPVPIVTVDRNGSLTYANEEAKGTLGIEESEASSRTYDDPQWEITQFNGEPFPEEELPFSIAYRTREPVYDVRHAITRPHGEKRYLSINAAPLFDAQGGFDGIVAATLDMTEQFQYEQQLRESEERYRNFFENAPIGIFQTDSSGQVLSVNPALAHMVAGESTQEVIDHYNDLAHQLYVHPERRSEFIALLYEYGYVKDFEYQARILNGSIRTHRLNARMHTVSPDGSFMIDGFATDTTDSKDEYEELQEVRKRFDLAIEGTGAGLWDWDMRSDIVVYSKRWKSMLGYEDHEIENSFYGWKKLWHPDDAPWIDTAIQDYLEGKTEKYEIIHRLLHKDGTWRWILTRGGVLKDSEGTPYRWVGTNLDITNSKQNEEKLKKAVEEKDFLMRELNHRVKNNLLMVSSLISMKESTLGSEVDLSDLRNQVNAIQKVHETLQQSDEPTYVNLKEYVAGVLSSVFQYSGSRGIAVENNVPGISVPTKAGVSIGLIVNEMATNALKHGFTEEDEARFTVAMEEDSTGENYIFTITNTGRPFPDNVDIENPQGLGLQLVSALVAQLQGTLELQRKPQPVFTIRFPMSGAQG